MLLVLIAAAATQAQETRQASSGQETASLPTESMTRGAWEFGFVAGGGADLAYPSDTHFLDAGARIGWILTGNHGRGWSRGNFEWAVELLPVYTVFTSQGAVMEVASNRLCGDGISPAERKSLRTWTSPAGFSSVPTIFLQV